MIAIERTAVARGEELLTDLVRGVDTYERDAGLGAQVSEKFMRRWGGEKVVAKVLDSPRSWRYSTFAGPKVGRLEGVGINVIQSNPEHSGVIAGMDPRHGASIEFEGESSGGVYYILPIVLGEARTTDNFVPGVVITVVERTS